MSRMSVGETERRGGTALSIAVVCICWASVVDVKTRVTALTQRCLQENCRDVGNAEMTVVST